MIDFICKFTAFLARKSFLIHKMRLLFAILFQFHDSRTFLIKEQTFSTNKAR